MKKQEKNRLKKENYNKKGTYSLVRSSGEVVGRFRTIINATHFKKKLEEIYFEKIKIVLDRDKLSNTNTTREVREDYV